MHKINNFLIFLLGTVLLLILLTACQNPKTPTISAIPTATPDSPSATEGVGSISPIGTPTISIPTPGNEVATVYGTLLDSKGSPLSSMPVYLGKFDGVLAEISLNHSPKTVTDGSGNFVFTNIPPNDDSFQYTIGVIWGSESGTIIKDPSNNKTLSFDVTGGEMIDLGVLKSDF